MRANKMLANILILSKSMHDVTVHAGNMER